MANGTAIDPTKPLTESWDKRVNQCSPALYACAAQNMEHIIVVTAKGLACNTRLDRA